MNAAMACVSFMLASATVAHEPASQPAEAEQKTRPPEPHAPVVGTKPKPGPKYFDLRYDEDFSYLDGEPGSYQKDVFDPIKNVRLGKDLRLTLGGEFRYRMEAETNKAFGATEPSQDTFNLFRFFLHADLKYRRLFRVFVQGITAFDEDRDLTPRPVDENKWDLHQLFFDFRFLGEERPGRSAWAVRNCPTVTSGSSHRSIGRCAAAVRRREGVCSHSHLGHRCL